VAFRDSQNSLLLALVLGIMIAYMILASQFNSLLHPITVLTILPLSIIGAMRLRPIPMTSALPPAIGLGPGSEIRTPMAIAVIGGVLLSTALSLFVVPAFYLLSEQWVHAVRRSFKRLAPSRSTHATEPRLAPAAPVDSPTD